MRGVWLYSIVTILYVIWIYSVDSILQNMGVEYSQNVVGTIITTEKLANAVNVPAPDLIVLTVVPIFEEIVFRWLPLFTVTTVFSLLVSLLKRKNINTIIPNNIGIACTIGGYLLQNAALGVISARTIALLQCSCPVITALFSFILLGEALSFNGMLGCVIILICLLAQNLIKE